LELINEPSEPLQVGDKQGGGPKSEKGEEFALVKEKESLKGNKGKRSEKGTSAPALPQKSHEKSVERRVIPQDQEKGDWGGKGKKGTTKRESGEKGEN